MNKLLSLWFLIGKWIMSIGLILVVLSIGYLIFNICYIYKTYEKPKISYVYVEPNLESSTDNSFTTSIKRNEEYREKVEKIVKNTGMTKNCVNVILDDLYQVEQEDKLFFILNMEAYYKKVISFGIKNAKKSYPEIKESEIKNYWKAYDVYKEVIVPLYFENYKQQKEVQKVAEKEHEIQIKINLCALGIGILLFILMLIIPILIRIEENTRKN